MKQAISRQERNIKVAATQLAQKYPGVELVLSGGDKLEKIVINELPDVKDDRLVDEVSRVTGAITTVFSYSEMEIARGFQSREPHQTAGGVRLQSVAAARGCFFRALCGILGLLGRKYLEDSKVSAQSERLAQFAQA